MSFFAPFLLQLGLRYGSFLGFSLSFFFSYFSSRFHQFFFSAWFCLRLFVFVLIKGIILISGFWKAKGPLSLFRDL